MRAISSALVLALGVAGLVAETRIFAQDKEPLTFVDAVAMPLITEAQVSPDGRQVLFVLAQPDWKINRPTTHIYRVNADGTNQVQLTFGERGESNARWSPDGNTIAFTARRDGDTTNQIYLLDTNGGEARRLTSHSAAPANLTWAADGKSIWFVATDARNAEERERDRVQDDVYAFEETNYKQRHLWTTDLAGKTKKMTDGDFSVASYDVSNDGTKVVTVRAPSPLFEHGRLGEVWISDADGSNAKRLTDNHVSERRPTIAPDNLTVAFTAGANAAFEGYYTEKIFAVPAGGGTPRPLLSDATFEVEDYAWGKDGRSIALIANHGAHNQVMRADVATGRVTTLTSGDHWLRFWSYDAGSNTHVFTRSTPTVPGEIYRVSDGRPATRVTQVFAYVERQFRTTRQERITWKGADGHTVEGILFYPLDYKAGQRYPLIVYSHGGPAESDKVSFSSDAQVYAAKGYAVLKPNYRGSTGYGDAVLRDVVKGYFKQAHLDVMTGTDAVIAMGVADPDKLAKMGWSAGGHMTNKIITFTDRFKAASSGAGAANLISLYAQSDVRESRTAWFGGTPWQKDAPIDLFWDHSPLKSVANVKTPTIFLVGELDPRVPMAQSVEMYRALKSNGVPTKLYIAPREGHGWGELRHRLFKFQVELEWFEKWVNNRAYTWERVPGEEKPAAKPAPTAQQ
jgi:dipeptidyl aminopeptidase/acylaminoacyl peptidase